MRTKRVKRKEDDVDAPPRKTMNATQCDAPIPLLPPLRGSVTIVPQEQCREVVTMHNFEFLATIPHTTVLLPSGSLVVCAASVLLNQCSSLVGHALVGATICIEIPSQLDPSDHDFIELLELLHERACGCKIERPSRILKSLAVAFLIATLQICELVTLWKGVVRDGFVNRKPSDRTFGLWWSVFQLFVERKLIDVAQLFGNDDTWTAALTYMVDFNKLRGRAGIGPFSAAALFGMLEIQAWRCGMQRVKVTGPGGKEVMVLVNKTVCAHDFKLRIYDEFGIKPEHQVWAPPCVASESVGYFLTEHTWPSRFAVQESEAPISSLDHDSSAPSERYDTRYHRDSDSDDSDSDDGDDSKQDGSEKDDSEEDTESSEDSEDSEDGDRCDLERNCCNKNSDMGQSSTQQQSLVLLLPTGQRILCDLVVVCRRSNFIRELVMQQQISDHDQGEIEISLYGFPRYPVSTVAGFFRYLQRPSSTVKDCPNAACTCRLSWMQIADYLQIDVPELVKYLWERLARSRQVGWGIFWELVDVLRLNSVYSSCTRSCDLLTSKDMYTFLSDEHKVRLHDVASLIMNAKQRQRLQQELGDFFDQWMIDKIRLFSRRR